MKAQTLYDLRDIHEYCSGSDLQNFFHQQGLGMSPSGRREIPTGTAKAFMIAGVKKQYSPGDGVVGDKWRDAALKAIQAAF